MADVIKLGDEANKFLDYFIEKDKELAAQQEEVGKARQHLVALVQDVVNREGKRLEIDGEKFTFDLENREFKSKDAPAPEGAPAVEG